MTKRIIYTLLLNILVTYGCIAKPYCDIRKFSILDGLAANNISDLCQGSDNMMWFATYNGLSYYDGYTFHTFRDVPNQSDILTTNRILNIYPCKNYDLWCVTYDRKLYVYDTRKCSFQNIEKQVNDKFKIDLCVDKIYPIHHHSTWITSADHKFCLRLSKKEFDENNPEFIKMDSKHLPSGKVWFITADKKGVSGYSPTKEPSSMAPNSVLRFLSNGSVKWATPSISPLRMEGLPYSMRQETIFR